jgi:hypothetical protein
VLLGVLAALALRSASGGLGDGAPQVAALVAAFLCAVLYLAVQYSRTDVPAVVVGAVAGILGAVGLAAIAGRVAGWPQALAAADVIAGAALLGAVTNGMMLGHWYLNQPGLKPWALARLTNLSLGATVLSAAVGLLAAGRLSGATTSGAALGLPGFGDSLGVVFYLIWGALVAFTGTVVWAARRCVALRSIQSATGLYYVAILTAGVSEFIVRYLMVNAR